MLGTFRWWRRFRGGRWARVTGYLWGKRWVRVTDACIERVDEDWRYPETGTPENVAADDWRRHFGALAATREELDEEQAMNAGMNAELLRAAKAIKAGDDWPEDHWPSPVERAWYVAAQRELAAARQELASYEGDEGRCPVGHNKRLTYEMQVAGELDGQIGCVACERDAARQERDALREALTEINAAEGK